MSEPRARAAADDAAAAHDIAAEADRRGKSAAAFRTISEVSEEIDVPAHVLRFWETKFAQLAPMKRGGGRRYYRPADVALLKGVRRLLYEEGLTIKGLQKLLREKGVRHVAGLGEGVALELDPAPALEGAEATGGLGAIIARLEAVRDRLREA